jgi:hypothetical protein
MAQLIINDVTVTLPDMIPVHGDSSSPLRLNGSNRVINCLKSYLLTEQGKQFPRQITEALKAGKGNIEISYTGSATPAKPGDDIGDVNHGKQGGDHWLENRTANYTISIDYCIDQVNHPLLNLTLNNTATHTTKTNYQKKNPDFHQHVIRGHQSDADKQNAVALGTFLTSGWNQAGSDTVSKDYSSDVEKMLMRRTIEENKKAQKELTEQAARAREAEAQAEQRRAAAEIARRAAEEQAAQDREATAQANRIAQYQRAGEELGQAAIVEQIRQQEREDILTAINLQHIKPLRVRINKAEMNAEEFQALFKAAILASRKVILDVSMEGHAEIAKKLYIRINCIEAEPSIVFKGEAFNFLGYNNIEVEAPVALNDVAIHLQRVEAALVEEVLPEGALAEEEEEPVPPMPPENRPIMMFSQGLQLPTTIPAQQLGARPSPSYSNASPR